MWNYTGYVDWATSDALMDARIAKRVSRRSGEMTANEWRNNDYGSAEPRACSMETIFAAYRDYRSSQQWN